MSLCDDAVATRARSRALCERSVALCTEALSLTTPRGATVLPPGQWRYLAARVAAARCACWRASTAAGDILMRRPERGVRSI